MVIPSSDVAESAVFVWKIENIPFQLTFYWLLTCKQIEIFPGDCYTQDDDAISIYGVKFDLLHERVHVQCTVSLLKGMRWHTYIGDKGYTKY